MNTTKIIGNVGHSAFKQLVSAYETKIVVSSHALSHLSIAQRNVFKTDELIKILLTEKPYGVGLQKNGRFAVFYRRKDGFLKLIIEEKMQRLEIITFINVDSIPQLGRLP